MTQEDINKQLVRIEGFTEGYKTALQWMSMAIEKEAQEKANESANIEHNKPS